MDPIKLLRDDHKKVKGLFREFEAAGDRAFQTKAKVAQQIFTELEVHTTIEEEIFYPAIEASASKEEKELVAEGYEEHHVVDVLINELKAMTPEDERYDGKFTVLIENVEHHIEEEEGEMLPDAEKTLKGDLDQLGDQMKRRKEELLTAMGAPA